jgi:hypothetical protein
MCMCCICVSRSGVDLTRATALRGDGCVETSRIGSVHGVTASPCVTSIVCKYHCMRPVPISRTCCSVKPCVDEMSQNAVGVPRAACRVGGMQFKKRVLVMTTFV